MKYRLLLDFDGTITKQDTCIAMVEQFANGSWEHIEEMWSTGDLSTQECAVELFKIMDFTETQLKEHLLSLDKDGYFNGLLEICSLKKIDVAIVSDGYDFNIKTILDANKCVIKDIYSNVLSFNEEGKVVIEFPYSNNDCRKCGTCKRNIYNEYKKSCDKIIYVGDGYSDRCVGEIADILFAKDSLAKYCDYREIDYIPYKTFKDVIEYIEKI